MEYAPPDPVDAVVFADLHSELYGLLLGVPAFQRASCEMRLGNGGSRANLPEWCGSMKSTRVASAGCDGKFHNHNQTSTLSNEVLLDGSREARVRAGLLAVIAVVACEILYAPSIGAEQAGKVFHIGFLSAGLRSGGAFSRDEFRLALRDAGYVEGKNIMIEERFAEAEVTRLPALAAELVGLKVDAIVTTGWAAAQAAKKATTTIPIVLLGAGDPVGTGLVASMARPGGNITGVTEFSTDLSGKRLQLLTEAVPGISRVAVLYNSSDPAMTLRYRAFEQAAVTLRIVVQPLGVREPAEFDSAFSAMTKDRPDAIMMVTDALTMLNRKLVVTFATTNHLPLAVEFGNIVRDGALMSYGWNFNDFYPRVAYFLDRILKGDTPADLPIEGPTRFYLVINLKTASQVGLTIPQSILALADEVIE